jgi:hypothetical protein
MDAQTLKQRILKGEMSDEEISKLLVSKTPRKQSGTFMKTVLAGFIDGYATPQLWKIIISGILFLSIIVGIIILSYAGKIDAMVTSILLAFILGFLFGKVK